MKPSESIISKMTSKYEALLVLIWKQLTRKDFMVKNMKKFKRQLEKESKLDEAAMYLFSILN